MGNCGRTCTGSGKNASKTSKKTNKHKRKRSSFVFEGIEHKSSMIHHPNRDSKASAQTEQTLVDYED